MTCPYLKEVSMVFCRAYPVKKLIPRARGTTACPCMSDGFERCPFFQEFTARTGFEPIDLLELVDRARGEILAPGALEEPVVAVAPVAQGAHGATAGES